MDQKRLELELHVSPHCVGRTGTGLTQNQLERLIKPSFVKPQSLI